MMLLAKRKKEPVEKEEHEQPPKISASVVMPIRQTASIFKQSVTIVKNMESKARTDIVQGPQEKPKQVFWEKRLQGLNACNQKGRVIETFELPSKIKAVGLQLGDETILRSITTALHLNGHPITGQNKPRALLDKSPGAFINPAQPLVLGLHVTDEDIELQEKKVHEARERLKEALKDYF
ncbi:methyl-CpG-binding domain protein 2-like [Uloborus diversus]|uniref:methyl-CpG-binding domain protein 2-like n=1 Tax=Uloborus diversus TaxID=327109 RepID=UPI002409A4C2|nr:methyl-CpG-binding domain protein 2-like [Uloborus diversus]XP_054724693.1 methyl-CpG-binding domain protein 2-like [Uloborus diversus]